MFKVLFEIFLVYLLYKLIFDFIVPVYKSTKLMRKQVNQMVNEQQQYQQNQQYYSQAASRQNSANNHYQSQQSNTSSTPKNIDESDYVEFEEVKN